MTDRRHLHFDDRHAVSWHHTLSPALNEARAAGKCVLVHISRADCGGSRALIERILPKEEITFALRADFVCVCNDAKQLDPDIAAQLQAAPRHEPTPVCLYLDGSGRLLYSTVGGRPAAVFMSDLTEAHSRASHATY
jgi:uncharacterized protein YyaL (SSP411 family)